MVYDAVAGVVLLHQNYLARSSKGRTAGFGPAYLGSSPSLAAKTKATLRVA